MFAGELLDFFVESVGMLERASEYFGYKEEYFMNRPYLFLRRKYRQFNRSQYEKRRYAQTDVFHALFAQLDIEHNGGKQVDKILLPDYRDALDGVTSESDFSLYERKAKTPSQQFRQDDFDPFAFMPQDMKERLKKEKRDKMDLAE